MSDTTRIPALDGFRALSIILVLVGHLQGTRGFGRQQLWSIFGDLAHLGVQVFFVISGLLITSLLLEEQERTGTLSLRRFYIRRSLRIFPAFFFFLGALLGAQAMGWISLSTLDVVTAATYTVNYLVDRSWYVGHLWSLSVEEQFYLLWPFAMVCAKTRKQALVIAVTVFLMAPVVRVAMHVAIPSGPARDLEIFPAVADAIAAGCVMALTRGYWQQQEWYRRATASPWIWLALIPVLLVSKYKGFTAVDALGTPVSLALIAVLIDAGTRRVRGPVAAALNWRPVVFVGTLSYSLYLWQQPFLNRQCTADVCAFPLNISLAVVCALFSYFLLGRPLLGLRKRYAAPGSQFDRSRHNMHRSANV